jgi:hypothetical protein
MDTHSRPSISRRSLLASTAALLIAGTTTGRARTITQEFPAAGNGDAAGPRASRSLDVLYRR